MCAGIGCHKLVFNPGTVIYAQFVTIQSSRELAATLVVHPGTLVPARAFSGGLGREAGKHHHTEHLGRIRDLRSECDRRRIA